MESFRGGALQIQIPAFCATVGRLDRHLTSEGCNMQYFLHGEDIKVRPSVLLIIRIRSHIVLLYINIIVPSFNVTHNNFYVEATHSERCTLEDLYSYFYYYNVIIVHYSYYCILITIIVIAIITIIITIIIIILLLVVVERINYSVIHMMAGMSAL